MRRRGWGGGKPRIVRAGPGQPGPKGLDILVKGGQAGLMGKGFEQGRAA